ncbi:MAG: Ppx/GppA family phosphatase [Nitrospirales bacterium]|nr:MAG: Ppx/GppA family phosphatase [Nitrospirales bacterium]
MRLAAIDIGTLTCRLLVADVNLPGEFKEIDADRRILRLGEGVDQHKRLSMEAMDRVVGTRTEWREKTSKYSLDAVVVVATSAVRESENRQEFLMRVKQETGWDIEILTGEKEARRTLLGIQFGLPATISDFWGLDIGGGSTECILARRGQSPQVISLDLGVVRLLERAFHHDPPTAQDLQNAEVCIDEEFAKVVEAFGEVPNIPLVGTAGTVTTLAALAQRLKQYDRTRVHNYELTLATVKSLEKDLIEKTGSERLAMPGLEPGREYVIVAGTIILRRLMETFDFESCLVSDYGLREGILVDLAKKY